jgi:hypothetical protein
VCIVQPVDFDRVLIALWESIPGDTVLALLCFNFSQKTYSLLDSHRWSIYAEPKVVRDGDQFGLFAEVRLEDEWNSVSYGLWRVRCKLLYINFRVTR